MTDGNHSTEKLTKRELFAAMAMQGNMARDYSDQQEPPFDLLITWSVKAADALIAELNKEQGV